MLSVISLSVQSKTLFHFEQFYLLVIYKNKVVHKEVSVKQVKKLPCTSLKFVVSFLFYCWFFCLCLFYSLLLLLIILCWLFLLPMFCFMLLWLMLYSSMFLRLDGNYMGKPQVKNMRWPFGKSTMLRVYHGNWILLCCF